MNGSSIIKIETFSKMSKSRKRARRGYEDWIDKKAPNFFIQYPNFERKDSQKSWQQELSKYRVCQIWDYRGDSYIKNASHRLKDIFF